MTFISRVPIYFEQSTYVHTMNCELQLLVVVGLSERNGRASHMVMSDSCNSLLLLGSQVIIAYVYCKLGYCILSSSALSRAGMIDQVIIVIDFLFEVPSQRTVLVGFCGEVGKGRFFFSFPFDVEIPRAQTEIATHRHHRPSQTFRANSSETDHSHWSYCSHHLSHPFDIHPPCPPVDDLSSTSPAVPCAFRPASHLDMSFSSPQHKFLLLKVETLRSPAWD